MVGVLAVLSCRFDRSYRDYPQPTPPECTAGDVRCTLAQRLEQCEDDGTWHVSDDCKARGLVCATALLACATCDPGTTDCRGQAATVCAPDGTKWNDAQTCDTSSGYACRAGSCTQLCTQAASQHSNVGCEYWGADLDNACLGPTLCAARQQYAIVVSNVQPDVPANVKIEEDDAPPGQPAQTRVASTAVIAARNLEVFKLGPREVDGSPPGEFNTGTGTALTRHAYKITSDFPIVAYQFNPLENVNVFSNDASQLLPQAALVSSGRAYVIAGWPQTIATTTDPATNFGIDLRAFLAIVATRPDTHVHVKTTARVIAGGPFPQGIPAGGEVDATLQPYEVLNLETGDFDADFTGTLVDSDQPVAAFPGSEASDAPEFQQLAQRFCCADHLEDQATPVRAVGKSYVLSKMPNRTSAVIAAGGHLGEIQETEYWRVVAVKGGKTHVTTTLPPPWDSFELNGEGDTQTIDSKTDFVLDASQPAIVLDVQASQDAGGVPRGLPGGDPSITYVSPREQWRDEYVLLTPDKYNFDYLVIAAPSGAHVYVDGLLLDATNSEVTPGDSLTAAERGKATPPYWTYRYQLSYPVIDPTQQPPHNVLPGKQNDGVHHIQSDQPCGVVAYGFDSYVSYAYAGGTQLTEINPL